jgi:hypothetical protein
MSAEDDVDELIKQFTLAQAELMKGNSEPAKEMCSHRQDVTLANPLGPCRPRMGAGCCCY